MDEPDGASAIRGLDQLRAAVAGAIITPADQRYEDARRVWNGMIDRRPAVVVRAAVPEDVAQAIAFARDRGLPLAVRGGGHGVAGNGTVDDGVVLDLGALDHVAVDAEARVVRVGGGATLGQVDRATIAHELAVPLGVVSGTGVAGLTLGGGVGWLTRPFGLSIDSLLAADVVTADGRTLRASPTENNELFWGLRGGGGNFGVVTEFTFRAHPLAENVLSGNFVYARPHWRSALEGWSRWVEGLPDEMQSIFSFLVPPPEVGFGEEPLFLAAFTWASADAAEFDRLVDELRRLAPPDVEEVGAFPWLTWQSSFDLVVPKGTRAYMKNVTLNRLDEDVIAAFLGRAEGQTFVTCAFDIHHMGGAVARVQDDATPYPNRSAPYLVNVYAFWNDTPDDAVPVSYVRGLAADLEPFSAGGRYLNFIGAEHVTDRRAEAVVTYGEQTLARLAALKHAYDPENLFRLNHNIPPL